MSSDRPPDDTPAAPSEPGEPRHSRSLPSLSPGMRVVVFVAGWTLVLVGVAGLALPGIQGILTIVIGVSVLSLASETSYRLLKRALHRWPGLRQRIDRLRHKVHRKLHRDG